jgi:hypothetical protein
MNSDLIPAETIEKKILILRNQKVMLDLHVAELYEIDTKALKRAVKWNQDRFPNDFCFQLTLEKFRNLRYHFGTSNWGGIRYALYAFTQQGVTIIAPTVRLSLRRSLQVMESAPKKLHRL